MPPRLSSWPERILFCLSRRPEVPDYSSKGDNWSLGDALTILEGSFPEFDDLVRGKRVLDFGCGFGFQAVAMAKHFNASVVAVESNLETLEKAKAVVSAEGLRASQLQLLPSVNADLMGRFDIIISQNSFEHFDDPGKVLMMMRELLCDTGKILITFGPPWFAPYGSHMHFFCRVPWINLLFPDEAVHKVRSYYRDDQSRPYEGLNRMTIRKFESLIQGCGMKAEVCEYWCVKRWDFLSKVPVVRELFVNQVNVVLVKA